MNKASLNIEMPGVDFAGMAREAIAAKVTEAMIGADDAIIKIVAAAMSTKVDSNGHIGRWASDNTIPYAEWLAGDLIRNATKAVLAAKVEQLRPAIEAQVEKALAKNTKSIAFGLTDAFVKQATSGYGVKIEMSAQMLVRD